MMKLRAFVIVLPVVTWTTAVWAVGPDVIVGGLGEGGISNDYQKYDTGGAIIAYSFSTTSCNQGTQNLLWTAGNSNHPVIGQGMYRLKDGQFEQLGQSWLKHGFCALDQNFCQLGCSGTGCGSLGVGCSDPYTASRNAASGLGPKSDVNAATGAFTYPPPMTSGGSGINGRLQVRRADVDPNQNPGALYFAEGQYIHNAEPAFGNAWNNASYRRINISASLNLSFPEATQRRLPAIVAWDVHDVGVKLDSIDIAGDGRIWVGYNVTDNGDGTWHYEYAVQNLNSDRSVGSFSLAMAESQNRVMSGVGFHDVDYHSGEPFDGGNWPSTVGTSDIVWQTQQTFAQNPNANAIRWGTLYNFRFDANAAPEFGTATLGLFKPGSPGSVQIAVLVPTAVDPVPAPGAPTNVQVTAQNDVCDELNVSWTPAGGTPADDFEIWRNSVDDSGTATLVDTTVSVGAYTDDSFIGSGENGSTWFYWVKACNTAGCSPFSNSDSNALTVKGDFDFNALFDGRDVNGFAAAAVAGSGCADLAAPFGTIDDADTVAMVGLLIP